MRGSRSQRTVVAALLASLLLHAAALVAVPASLVASAPAPSSSRPIEVALLEPPPKPPEPKSAPRQIVTPPDAINDEEPENTRLESDRDNRVAVQTVRPGVPKPAPPVPPRKPEPQPRKPVPAPPPKPEPAERDDDGGAVRREPSRGRAPALEDLFASTDELLRAQRGDQPREQPERPADRPGAGKQRLALAVPPVTPEWSLPGRRGALDYLPDIRRGDVTLLNTKANVFAPFVRRVGERVFQHLVIRQRRLELPQILNARQPVLMKVLLDRRGKLKSVRVENQSGSASMDGTLSDALASGAFDNNPPPAAANANGDYEFVFQAQLRAVTPGAGGVPSRIESRLSVGLL